MNRKHVFILLLLAVVAFEIAYERSKLKQNHEPQRSPREQVLDEVGLDVAAIHRATDVVNGQIERGEIRDWDTLRQRVTDEVAFQKIAIREEINKA